MLLEDFYSVINSSRTGENIITELQINKEHDIFNGHFPGRPVTPGVILMQLFKEEVERQVKSSLRLQKATNVKFIAVVDPNVNDRLILDCTIEEEAGVFKLKGVAKQKDVISLKINCLYVSV